MSEVDSATSRLGLISVVLALAGLGGQGLMWAADKLGLQGWVIALVFWLSAVALVAALILGGWLAYLWLSGRNAGEQSWLPTWRVRLLRSDLWPVRRVVPMRKAIRIAHQKTRGTAAAYFAEQEGPTKWFAMTLWDGGDSHLFGVPLNGIGLVKIPRDEFRMSHFTADGQALQRLGEKSPAYTNVHIIRADMMRKIRDMMTWGDAPAEGS